MKTYNYSEAQQNYSMVLNTALRDDVFIRRKISTGKRRNKSPFEVSGIDTNITKQEIIEFVRAGREKQ